jgi:uncharacterized membrane protein YdfJ with MMPL/SSD domain
VNALNTAGRAVFFAGLTVVIVLLYPSTAPQAAQTAKLLDQLRNQVVPAAEAGSGLRVLIGGVIPTEVDFSNSLASKLPLFMAVVVILAFLLLMLVFRRLVIPAMASVMNLLSVSAALGVINAAFAWGWARPPSSYRRSCTCAGGPTGGSPAGSTADYPAPRSRRPRRPDVPRRCRCPRLVRLAWRWAPLLR